MKNYTDFVINREYRLMGQPNIAECIGRGKDFAVMRYSNGHDCLVYDPEKWEEYKEPLEGKCYVNIFQNAHGEMHTSSYPTRIAADNTYFAKLRIACIEIPWKEGQGL